MWAASCPSLYSLCNGFQRVVPGISLLGLGLKRVCARLSQKMSALPACSSGTTMLTLLVADAVVQNVVDMSQRNPMQLLKDCDSTFLAATLLASCLHRVVLIDDQHKVRAMLTRADVIRYVHTLLDRVDVKHFLEGLTLSSLGFVGQAEVRTIKAHGTLFLYVCLTSPFV